MINHQTAVDEERTMIRGDELSVKKKHATKNHSQTRKTRRSTAKDNGEYYDLSIRRQSSSISLSDISIEDDEDMDYWFSSSFDDDEATFEEGAVSRRAYIFSNLQKAAGDRREEKSFDSCSSTRKSKSLSRSEKHCGIEQDSRSSSKEKSHRSSRRSHRRQHEVKNERRTPLEKASWKSPKRTSPNGLSPAGKKAKKAFWVLIFSMLSASRWIH